MIGDLEPDLCLRLLVIAGIICICGGFGGCFGSSVISAEWQCCFGVLDSLFILLLRFWGCREALCHYALEF